MILQQILTNPQQYSNVLLIDDIYSRRFVPLIFNPLLTKQSAGGCYLVDADQSAENIKEGATADDRVLSVWKKEHSTASISTLFDRIVDFVFKDSDDIDPEEESAECRVVILNSLSSLVYRYGAAKTMALVQRLLGYKAPSRANNRALGGDPTRQDICVVALVHGDAHDQRLLEQLKLNTYAVIRLRDVYHLRQLVGDEHEEDLESVDKELKRQERAKLALIDAGRNAEQEDESDGSESRIFQAHLLCNIFSMRMRSKLLFHKEYFKVDTHTATLVHVRNPFQNKMLQDSMQRAMEKGKSSRTTTAAASTTTALDKPKNTQNIDDQVPFRLGLSVQEKRQRETVVLPYVRDGIQLAQQQQQMANARQQAPSNQRKGLIIVDSDEEFDEEDPDEDLEI